MIEEKYIEIYRVDDYKLNMSIWLEDLLKEDNIPYKTEIEEYWVGVKIPKYMKRLKIFIPKKYEHIVRKYINEAKKKSSTITKDIKELKDVNDNELNKEIKKYNRIKKIWKKCCATFFIIIVIVLLIMALIN